MINDNPKQFEKFTDETGSFIDGKVICRDCGKEFEITSHEISHFYHYNQCVPKRCKECRNKRKNRRF